MPFRNRVTPFSEIIESPARGTLWGNRGVLHNDARQLVRSWQVRRWIACKLEFKGRRRADPMPPGRFTGLFFWTSPRPWPPAIVRAPNAGGRTTTDFGPCGARPTPGQPSMADDMDRVLHAERLGPKGSKRVHLQKLSGVPDGAMIVEDERAWLVSGRELRAWTPFGYEEHPRRRHSRTVAVLTSPSIVTVIRLGYRPAMAPDSA